MKIKFISIALALSIISCITGCANTAQNKPPLPTDSSATGTNQVTTMYDSFLNLLDSNGFEYIESEISKDSFLSVPKKPILIGEEIIELYEYISNDDMEKYAAYIDNSGCSINTPGNSVEISWASYPHFFKKDTLIINYVGEDESIFEFLNTNFGPPFAGYECSNN